MSPRQRMRGAARRHFPSPAPEFLSFRIVRGGRPMRSHNRRRDFSVTRWPGQQTPFFSKKGRGDWCPDFRGCGACQRVVDGAFAEGSAPTQEGSRDEVYSPPPHSWFTSHFPWTAETPLAATVRSTRRSVPPLPTRGGGRGAAGAAGYPDRSILSCGGGKKWSCCRCADIKRYRPIDRLRLRPPRFLRLPRQ